MYELHDVSQVREFGYYEIRFTLFNHEFSILVEPPSSGSSKHLVQSVYHESYEICPICQKKGYLSRCDILFDDLDALFEQLISTNALRLHWLFIEYERKGGGETNGHSV